MSRSVHFPETRAARGETKASAADRQIQRTLVILYTVAAFIGLVALSIAVHFNPYFPIDLQAARAVQSIHAGWYDILMRIVGMPGYPPQVYVLVIWTIGVLYFTGMRWEAVMETFAVVGIGVVGYLVKFLVNRPRPSPDLVRVMTLLDNGKLSFPAGHVESYVAIIGFLWFLAFVLSKNPWVRSISLLIYGEMISVIGISRVYTGEHWLTDSIGGYLLGSLWLILTIYLYEKGKDRYRDFHVSDLFSRWRKKPTPKAMSKTEEIETEVAQPIITWRQRVIQAGAIVGRPWRRYRARIFQGYLLAAIIVFAILAVLAHTVAYFAFDLVISRGVQTVNVAWFDALMRLVSWFGFAPQVNLVALMILVFLYVTGLKWEAVTAFIAAAGISIIGFAIKVLVDRPRPSADLIHVMAQLKDFSFPSGHVLFYTAFFGFLLFLTFTLLRPPVLRAMLLFLFGALVGLIGISRIYEGEHWASDVLAAYLLASVWLALMVRLYQWGKTRFFVNQPVAKETGKDTAAV